MASVSIFKSKNQSEAGTIHWLNECIKRGQREVFSEVVDMNPGLAAELLRRNPDNRPIRRKVLNYTADMIAGRWAFNGEPLIISSDGLLNDGQHRLNALIDANICLPMIVTFGVERVSRMTIDQGAARAAGDYLGMDNVPNATTAASVARIIMAVEAGAGANFSDATRVTNEEIRRRVLTDEAIGAAAHYAQQVNKHCSTFIAPAIVGTGFYLFTEISELEARDYMDRVTIGEGLRRGDPAFAVREALMGEGRSRRAAKLEILMHGWNKHRTNSKLKRTCARGSFPALI